MVRDRPRPARLDQLLVVWGQDACVRDRRRRLGAKPDAPEGPPTLPIATAHTEGRPRSGWTVGGGIESARGCGWAVKGEFLYAAFAPFRTSTSPPFGAADIFPRDVKVKDYIWRA